MLSTEDCSCLGFTSVFVFFIFLHFSSFFINFLYFSSIITFQEHAFTSNPFTTPIKDHIMEQPEPEDAVVAVDKVDK